MRRVLPFVLVFLLVIAVAAPLIPKAKADVTETRTFTSSISDAYIEEFSNVYAIVHDSASASAWDGQYDNYLGQRLNGATYYIWRLYSYFDTSAIPDGATIDSAILSLYIYQDFSTDDFNVTIQNGQPTYPHDPLQNGDYYYIRYSGTGGSRNTSEIGGAGYWNITLSETGEGWISKTGATKLCLRSNNDIASSAPSDEEWIDVYSKEQGSSYAPKLYVTYTVSSSELYSYNVYGPYVDSPTGTVYNGYVNVTVYPNFNETYTFTLDGTGGADSESFSFEQQPLMMTWNVSSTGNYTRTLYFTDATTEDIYIFVPNQNEPFYYYSFSIIDLHGITNGFLESRIYLNGEYRVVERQAASAINALPFIMQWSVIYKMRVVAGQGTLNVGDFTALNEANQNIIIAQGSFPTTQYGFNVTVACLRMNSTLIQMNYTDSAEATIWVHLLITHRSGNVDVTDYSENNTATTVQVNWNSASATVDYKATVTFYRNSQTYTYVFSCPAPADAENPFDFLPVPYCYAVATALTLFIGLVASYATKVAGAWAMTVLAAWFTWIGWFPQHSATWSIIAFAGLVSALLTIAEFKSKERTI